MTTAKPSLIHASQGLIIPRTHDLANDALFFEADLVALSRHKDTCHLYITEQLEQSTNDREESHVRQPGRDLASALEIRRADRAGLDTSVAARHTFAI